MTRKNSDTSPSTQEEIQIHHPQRDALMDATPLPPTTAIIALCISNGVCERLERCDDLDFVYLFEYIWNCLMTVTKHCNSKMSLQHLLELLTAALVRVAQRQLWEWRVGWELKLQRGGILLWMLVGWERSPKKTQMKSLFFELLWADLSRDTKRTAQFCPGGFEVYFPTLFWGINCSPSPKPWGCRSLPSAKLAFLARTPIFHWE